MLLPLFVTPLPSIDCIGRTRSETARGRPRTSDVPRPVLVLDLDHTLVHTTHADGQPLPAADAYYLLAGALIMKVRPGVRWMLAKLKARYRMVIYTMGEPEYAREAVKWLAPDGSLFGGRIVADPSAQVKTLDVVGAAEDRVVILDDRKDVWPPNNGANLLQVERYDYFPSHWIPAGTSLQELGCDEDETDGVLSRVTRLLLDVHARLLGAPAADVRCVLRDTLQDARRAVLAGCSISFSRCWPTTVIDPSQQQLWQVAEALGAVCTMSYNPNATTHVVSQSCSTEKAWLARKDGKHVVGPLWLRACRLQLRRAQEAAYPAPHA